MINILLIIIASVVFIYLNLTLFLSLKRYSNNKKIISFISKFRNFSACIMIIVLSYVFIDMVVLRLLGHGYPSDHEQEYIQRIPSPYDMFSGKPNVRDHNSDGFRGNNFVNAAEKQLSIAFFAGSTGYEGNPPITDLVNQKLNSDNIKTIVYNFSSVSSNHNQHLHRLLKFSKYNFDIVIFYGGYNETFQTLYSDPRPGYPYNFWIKEELTPIKFALLKYFSLVAEIDKQTGRVSKISKLRENVKLGSDMWINELLKNYENTLLTAKQLTENFINPNICKKTYFFAIYQPISLSKITDSLPLKTDKDLNKKIISKTHETIKKYNFIYDFSNLYEESMFKDSVHVTDEAKKIMASKITKIVKEVVDKKCLKK